MNYSKIVFKITTPENNEIEISAMEQLLTALYNLDSYSSRNPFEDLPASIALEIVGKHDEIVFYVVVPASSAPTVEKQIYAAYPTANVELAKVWSIWDKPGYVSYANLKPTGKDYFPYKTHEQLKVDTMNGLTSPLSKLKVNEGIAIQFLLRPSNSRWVSNGRSYLNLIENNSRSSESGSVVKADQKLVESLEKKLANFGYELAIKIVTVSSDKDNSEALLNTVVASFQQFSYPGYSGFTRNNIRFKNKFMSSFINRQFSFWDAKIVASTEELATMYHFPNKNVTTPNISWVPFKTGTAPVDVPEKGIYLGKSMHRGEERKIFQNEDDRRRHTYILGQTGTGKSELMKFLAIQDINNGHGVAFIDPHGDAVEDILTMIPKERALDVIYFNAGDTQRPLGLNMMDVEKIEQQHYMINSFIAMLYKLYDPNRHGIMGPILERAIRNTMLTAMSEPGNTMVEVLRLITDDRFVQAKLPLVKDPLVRRYWTDQIAKTANKEKSEHLGYFTSKFDRFVTEKLMRNIVGQSKSAFDLRDIMDNKKILLVNLSKGQIGEENSNFLGLLLIPRILIAALSRGDVSDRKDVPDFYLYVDEFQNFATDAFATMLSEVRKYKLALTVANQYLAQLPDDISNAVFGNVGTFISFRVGTNDAEFLEPQFAPKFDKNDLMNNAVGNAYAKLLINNQPSIPFSLVTDWTAMQGQKRDQELANKLKEFSRLKYGRDKDIVEQEIRFRSNL